MSDWVRVRQDTEYYPCSDGSGPMARVNCPDFADRFPGGATWDAYPMPVEHESRPKSGDNNLIIPRLWWEYYWDINTLEGAIAGSRIAGGYIQANLNVGRAPGWVTNYKIPRDTDVLPIVDGITMGSWLWSESSVYQNIHKLAERKNGSTRVDAFLATDTPPDPAVINPQTTPHLFVLGTGIGRQGNSVLMNGTVTYWPLLVESKQGKPPAAWIDDIALEFNVEMPIMGTYGNLSNQGMINLFNAAFGENFWDDQVTRAGLTSMGIPDENRQLTYEGPTVGDMTLSYDERVLLRDQLIRAGYSEPPIAPPAGGVDLQPIYEGIGAAEAELAGVRAYMDGL